MSCSLGCPLRTLLILGRYAFPYASLNRLDQCASFLPGTGACQAQGDIRLALQEGEKTSHYEQNLSHVAVAPPFSESPGSYSSVCGTNPWPVRTEMKPTHASVFFITVLTYAQAQQARFSIYVARERSNTDRPKLVIGLTEPGSSLTCDVVPSNSLPIHTIVSEDHQAVLDRRNFRIENTANGRVWLAKRTNRDAASAQAHWQIIAPQGGRGLFLVATCAESPRGWDFGVPSKACVRPGETDVTLEIFELIECTQEWRPL